MTRKLRKAVAFLLIAVLFVQQCSVTSLAGDEGEPAEEAPVEEQGEVQEQEEIPEPEVAETQPPETQAPEPTPETSAPETSAPETQVPETNAPETQAAETQAAETQAAETQAETAESEEKAEPESETERESESETERSDRENTGDPVTGSDLASMLSSALPYLFVTGDLSFSADEKDPSIPEDWILDGDDGSDVVSDLKSSATILADATSSFDVTVINLYADENGSLDTAQLDAIFPDQVIDVTNTYYLVNVIADSQTQELSFSGFAMKEDGETLSYTEETQPGAVLYNFAAYDETTYQDYTGTLHLSGGFEGTVLAPAASVQVEGDLSGAAYADQVKVKDVYADLMKIVFYEGIEEETETESETESETEESQTEVSTESETEVIEEIETEEETEIDTETVAEPMSAIKPIEGEGTILVTAEVKYENTPLTPVEDIKDVYFVALFIKNEDGSYKLVDGMEPVPLEFTAGIDKGACNLFYSKEDLDESETYYVLATDAEGEPINEGAFSVVPIEVELTDVGLSDTAELDFVYSKDWGDLFYYTVSLTISVSLTGHKGENYSVENETFSYKVDDADVKVQVKNDYKGSEEIDLKATAPEQTFYIEEELCSEAFSSDFNKDVLNISVECGKDPDPITLEYKLNDSTIILKITDTYGDILSKASFVIMNESGEIISKKYSGEKTLKNTASKTELQDGETFYLYEIDAPSGYTPGPAVSFTVEPGLTTETVIKNSDKTTKYSLNVTKSTYVDDIPVYAYGSTDPVYVALFSDKSHSFDKKVSNVQKLSMSGYTGTLTFSDLTNGSTYYVAETDEYGIALSSTDSHKIVYRNGATARETSSGKIEIAKNNQTMLVENIYTSLPSGYRYAVDLTIKKNVTDSSGSNSVAVSETFYVGLFRNADYSDTPIIVPLSCNNSSSASSSRRVLLSGEDSVTYYIAEVDANGNRITDSSDFGYYPSDPQTVTLTKEDAKSGRSVAFTNRAKESNKVTLTLSKRVYEGSDLLPVDETFYVGLFKDENLTTAYTSPIAMNLSDADSLTLKLTLNIGNKTDATVYIAEVDASGNLVQSSKEFGYSCYVANNKVVFSQSRKSAQSVLVNFVYGTDTRDAIDSVLGDLDDYFGDEDFTFDENGDFYGDGSVDTGDTTPIAGCAAVMAASLLIFALSCRRRRRAR